SAPFRPTTWGPGYKPIGPLSHFRQANVHGFTHYLDHPRVHIPLIRAALGDPEIIGEAEAEDAKGNYADIVAPECQQQVELVKAKAKEFDGISEDLELVAIRIAEFYALCRNAASKCAGLAQIDGVV